MTAARGCLVDWNYWLTTWPGRPVLLTRANAADGYPRALTPLTQDLVVTFEDAGVRRSFEETLRRQYDAFDEGTDEPDSSDPDWQESVFVHWYDVGQKVGGVHRIGHEPNRAGGRSALECAVFTADGTRFRRIEWELPTSSKGCDYPEPTHIQ
jgi:hypothetical protein